MLMGRALRYICNFVNLVLYHHHPSINGSATYSGTTKLAAPMANPTKLLPTIMPATVVANACHNAPRINRTSATRIIHHRPNLSAKMPAIRLATKAAKLVHEVMRLLSRVVSGCVRSVSTETRVEDITPVL